MATLATIIGDSRRMKSVDRRESIQEANDGLKRLTSVPIAAAPELQIVEWSTVALMTAQKPTSVDVGFVPGTDIFKGDKT